MPVQPDAPNSSRPFPEPAPARPARRSLLSVRKLALMASAVALIGASAYTLTPSGGSYDFLATPANAQVDSAVKNLQRPAGFADVVAQVKPSVISVRVKINRDDETVEDLPFPPGSPMERFFRRFGGPDGMPGPRGRGRRGMVTGQGSGFFISADGYAVTNNHVVDGADEVEVRTDDGKTYTAKVIGTDPRTDLALIKVDGGSASFPFAKLSETNPRIGDWVLAVGNPFGLGGTVTAGIVSASGRDIGSGPYDDFIQIDAPINKGNSGGPSFNIDGEVMGVNTAIYSPSGGNVGIAFSIPASTVRQVVAQLKEKGSVSRGWIGVQIQPVTQDIADSLGLKKAEGALVAEPQRGSPGDKAGIESGDVITQVNGEPVKDARVLARKIGSLAPGEKVKLTMLRKGEEKTIELTLGELPGPREMRAGRGDRDERRGGARSEVPRLGLSLAPAESVAGAGKDGVVVINVNPDSPAAERGFKEGDVILEVAGKEVSSVDDVREAIAEARKDSKHTVLLRVRSGDGSRFVALPLGRG